MSRRRSSASAIQLIAVGKIRPPHAAASDHYQGRISERIGLRVDEVALGHGDPREARGREARSIRRVILERAHVVGLDVAGQAFASSDDLAEWLAARLEVPVPLTFVIGGPDGLDPELAADCHERRSLGPLTLPHQVARVVLLEQLYRGLLTGEGHPYPR